MIADPASRNVVWHEATITRSDRERLNGHRGVILWFTGLSGSGKSTLAHAVEAQLFERGCRTFVLDGDNVRHGLCVDLGFSDRDRQENIRRIGEVAKLFTEAGVITLAAFVSPFRADRDRVRALVADGEYIEVYCQASLDVCEQRDVKGLYAKARAVIPEFTGISSPYEAPEAAELKIDTGSRSLDDCVAQVLNYLVQQGIISASDRG
nr:adenylyl-sulfate kinase [Synechococcus elongatus]QFZ92184.1 adenylyl-sulfate kinase [Synechococcus elongatus PCC 11802]